MIPAVRRRSPPQIDRGLTKGLAGDRPPVDALATDGSLLLDDKDALARLRGLDRGLLPSGTGADDDEVIGVIAQRNALRNLEHFTTTRKQQLNLIAVETEVAQDGQIMIEVIFRQLIVDRPVGKAVREVRGHHILPMVLRLLVVVVVQDRRLDPRRQVPLVHKQRAHVLVVRVHRRLEQRVGNVPCR